MNRLWLILLLPCLAFSQEYKAALRVGSLYIEDGIYFDSTATGGRLLTGQRPKIGRSLGGVSIFDMAGGRFRQDTTVAGGATDTTSLSNRINLKATTADLRPGAYLADTLKYVKGADSATFFIPRSQVNTALALKISGADSATFFMPRAQINTAVALKANTADLKQGAYFTDTTAVRSPRTAAGAEGSLWISNANNATATTTIALTANKLRASPFIPFTDIVIDSARFEISTAAAGGVVWGVYANKNESSIYPGSLIFSKYDTTSVAVKNTGANSTGYQAWGGNKTLKGGTLYWVAYNGNNTATARAIPQGAVVGVLGYSSSLAANVQITTLTVDRNMDWTLPGTFPANATALANVAVPVIVMRRDQ